MKGGKKKPSTESVQPPLLPPTSTVNGADDVAGAVEEHRVETDRLESTEETFEEDDDGRDVEDSANDKYHGYDYYEQLELEKLGKRAEAERSKLADGYYEIEAVRRKRVRKGQVQYLIKWRGWPEAENTWEPVANLMQCSDVIDAFEESLIAGRTKSTRGRKRKHGVTHTQVKKKQRHQSPVAVSHNVPSHKVGGADDPVNHPYPNNLIVTNSKGKTDISGVNGLEICKKVNQNGVETVSDAREDSSEKNELGLKLCELKGPVSFSGEHGDKCAVHSQQGLVTGREALANGLTKSDGVEPIQSGRCTGAKKRKSFPVKRFKQDSALWITDDTQNAVSSSGVVEQKDLETCAFMGNDRDFKNNSDASKDLCTIIQIIRPISYSTSTTNNVEEVSLTFEALRSDGTKIMVDNKFLKANNPILLINFYEKHLRYSPT